MELSATRCEETVQLVVLDLSGAVGLPDRVGAIDEVLLRGEDLDPNPIATGISQGKRGLDRGNSTTDDQDPDIHREIFFDRAILAIGNSPPAPMRRSSDGSPSQAS